MDRNDGPADAGGIEAALSGNLTVLAGLLADAATKANEAAAYARAGNRNAALGTIVGLDEVLADAAALQRAAKALRHGAR